MTYYGAFGPSLRKTDIRICTLLQGAPQDPIYCSLSVHALDECSDFEALSYAWGSQENRSNICVNGEDFLITENLLRALQQLRKPFELRRLWIDAVCINQDDKDEQSAQVSIMGSIYRRASCVISWMGYRDPQFDLIEEMQYAQDFIRHISFLRSHSPFRQYLEGGSASHKYAEFENHVTRFNIGLWSFQFLIGERKEQPEYWQRAWITQEVVQSGCWVLQVGAQTISDQNIEDVGRFLQLPNIYLIMEGRYRERILRASIRKTSVAPISVYRCLLQEAEVGLNRNAGESPPQGQLLDSLKTKASGPWALVDLLRYNQSRLCQNPRDKVYSVLGISDLARSDHQGLVINYNNSTAEVYTGAVQAIIEATSSLDVLCSVRLGLGPSELPSWVPDWNQKKTAEEAERPISFALRTVHGKISNKSESLFATCPYLKYPILTVWGLRLGKVAEMKQWAADISWSLAAFDATGKSPQALSFYRQICDIYRWAVGALAPGKLPAETFCRTCAVGLLDHHLDDGFGETMDDLAVRLKSSNVPTLSGFEYDTRYRFRTMVSALQGQSLFTIAPEDEQSISASTSSSPLENSISETMVGISPSGIVHQGDVVCLLHGCPTPLLLRQTYIKEVLHWKVVSPTYIDPLMDVAETLRDCLASSQYKLEKFTLI